MRGTRRAREESFMWRVGRCSGGGGGVRGWRGLDLDGSCGYGACRGRDAAVEAADHTRREGLGEAIRAANRVCGLPDPQIRRSAHLEGRKGPGESFLVYSRVGLHRALFSR